jgi:DNA recombination protein RmuC
MTISAIQVAVLAAVVLLMLLMVVLIARRGTRQSAPLPDRFIQDLSTRLARIEDISRQVTDMSNLFLVPHTRGGIGETFLQEYLANWLPRSSFDLQYTFRNGYRADAVISLGDHLVAVDSKFPLESIKRSMAEPRNSLPADVRKAIIKHVEDIAARYIQPAEGTMQFALMYIPAERVYYHVFVEHEDGLLAEALRRGVVPVSPGNLFLYLQTVAYGLRGFALPRSRRELMEVTHQLRKELDDLSQSMKLAGNHLRNFQRAFDDSTSRIQRLDLLAERFETRSQD